MSFYGFRCYPKYNDVGHYEGFTAQFYDRAIDVTIQDAVLQLKEKSLIIHTGGNLRDGCNPYAFYSIFNAILREFTNDYKVSDNSMFSKAPQVKQIEWFREKVRRYWCKAIHCEWLKLIERMDKKNLQLARALFAANFKSGTAAGNELLERINEVSNEHRQDILQFVPAAMLAHDNPEYFITYAPAKKHRHKILEYQLADEMDADFSDDLDEMEEWSFMNDASSQDWRGAFAHKSLTYIPDNLTETLRRVKPGVAKWTVGRLKDVVLDRVISSKPELIVYTEAHNQVVPQPFYASTKEDIVNSIKVLNTDNVVKLTEKKYSTRKTMDLINVMDMVAYAKANNPKNMLSLTEKFVDQYAKPVSQNFSPTPLTNP